MKHLLLLSMLFFLVNGMLFWKIGIMIDDDTAGFMTYAVEIREQGIFYKPHHFWYIGYSLFIVAVTAIHDSHEAIVIAQYLLSYTALICLYLASLKLFHNPLAALLTCIWFLGFFMIQFWNLYLYAESLLISLHCISFFFLAKWYRGETGIISILAGTVIIVATVMTKPTGMGLLLALVAVGVFAFWKNMETRMYKWGILVIMGIGFILLFNKMLSSFTFLNDYKIGEVVYNIHKLADRDYARWLMVSVPEDLYLPGEHIPPVIKLILVVLGNPWYGAKLFFTKLFYFLFYVRPYYSGIHNILALILLLPMYYSFVTTMRRKVLNTHARLFILTLIGFTVFTVCLMTINWNSRFLMPLLPLVFLVGGNGMERILVSLFRVPGTRYQVYSI